MESNLNRIVEAYKARMTVGLALMLGMVTITGYGVSVKEPRLFLVAAFVPIFAFFCDFGIVYRTAVPFAYRTFIVDASQTRESDEEAMGELFLAYGSPSQRNLKDIKKMDAGIERQRAFRRFYALRSIWLKSTVFALGCVGEISLWLFMK